MDKNIIITPDATLAPAGEAMPLRQGGTVTGTEARQAVFARRSQRHFFCGPSEAHTPSHIYVPPYLGGLRYGGLGFLRESVEVSAVRGVDGEVKKLSGVSHRFRHREP